MYGYTVHVKRFLMEGTVTVFVAVGISFDNELTWLARSEAVRVAGR
jgi:hypothetical protein